MRVYILTLRTDDDPIQKTPYAWCFHRNEAEEFAEGLLKLLSKRPQCKSSEINLKNIDTDNPVVKIKSDVNTTLYIQMAGQLD